MVHLTYRQFPDHIFGVTSFRVGADSYVTGANIAKGSKGSSDPIWDDGEKSLLLMILLAFATFGIIRFLRSVSIP
jgi:hypothetical protein